MGEEDVVSTNNYCPDASDRRDCDGDWDTYCTKIGSCPYQRKVIDCDGDPVYLCRK